MIFRSMDGKYIVAYNVQFNFGSSFVLKNEIQIRAKLELCRCARAFIGRNECARRGGRAAR